jgi:hypothetical protein
MTETLRRDPVTSERLNRGQLLLMSVATGLAVAGNYFAQPLLDMIGRELGLLLTSSAWTRAGWTGVSLLGGTLSTGTLALWALERVRTKSGWSSP